VGKFGNVSTALSFSPRSEPGWPAPPKLHHLDGAPVRAAICRGEHFERTRPSSDRRPETPVRAQLDRRLWCLPGIYCLFGQPDTTDPTDTYVGSAGDLIERLTTHDKTGWSHAIMLTGHGMGIGGARQAESAIGRVLSTKRVRRRLTPTWKAHPAPWGADMPWFLFEPLVVLLDLCLREVDVRVSIDPAVARL
jgi:hypothetical protein